MTIKKSIHAFYGFLKTQSKESGADGDPGQLALKSAVEVSRKEQEPVRSQNTGSEDSVDVTERALRPGTATPIHVPVSRHSSIL